MARFKAPRLLLGDGVDPLALGVAHVEGSGGLAAEPAPDGLLVHGLLLDHRQLRVQVRLARQGRIPAAQQVEATVAGARSGAPLVARNVLAVPVLPRNDIGNGVHLQDPDAPPPVEHLPREHPLWRPGHARRALSADLSFWIGWFVGSLVEILNFFLINWLIG